MHVYVYVPVYVQDVQVWNDDFFFKKTRKNEIKIGRMIKRDLFKVCSIANYTFFPSFGQFVDTTPVKIFSFCREPFIEPFFHIFVRIKALLSKCVTHRCKQVVNGRSQELMKASNRRWIDVDSMSISLSFLTGYTYTPFLTRRWPDFYF